MITFLNNEYSIYSSNEIASRIDTLLYNLRILSKIINISKNNYDEKLYRIYEDELIQQDLISRFHKLPRDVNSTNKEGTTFIKLLIDQCFFKSMRNELLTLLLSKHDINEVVNNNRYSYYLYEYIDTYFKDLIPIDKKRLLILLDEVAFIFDNNVKGNNI